MYINFIKVDELLFDSWKYLSKHFTKWFSKFPADKIVGIIFESRKFQLMGFPGTPPSGGVPFRIRSNQRIEN